MGGRICFTINGAVYHATLQENALAERIAAMCPFKAQYSRSGSHEYYAILPEKAAVKDCESTTMGHKNGLYYFEGWNALSLVIEDCNTAPYPIYLLGDFEEDVSVVLKKAGGRICIICELE